MPKKINENLHYTSFKASACFGSHALAHILIRAEQNVPFFFFLSFLGGNWKPRSYFLPNFLKWLHQLCTLSISYAVCIETAAGVKLIILLFEKRHCDNHAWGGRILYFYKWITQNDGCEFICLVKGLADALYVVLCAGCWIRGEQMVYYD